MQHDSHARSPQQPLQIACAVGDEAFCVSRATHLSFRRLSDTGIASSKDVQQWGGATCHFLNRVSSDGTPVLRAVLF
jgi:hypothetical protein